MAVRSSLAFLVTLLAAASVHAQVIHRNGFEANRTFWVAGPTDAKVEGAVHANTDQGAHSGLRSEYISLKVQSGSQILYQYPLGKAFITDELNGGLWIKANRPGIELRARVILPNERDERVIEAPMHTFLTGDAYQNAGRWQRLSLSRPTQLMKRQQQILQQKQQELKKPPLNFNDAYIDALVINVYGGPGPTEVWIDDLEFGPVQNEPIPAAKVPGATPVSRPNATLGLPAGTGRGAVEFNGTNLLVGGRPFFMRGIKLSDTPVKILHAAGFNTLFVEAGTDPKVLKEAAELGLYVVPMLPVLSDDPRFASAEGLTREVQKMADQENLLFWHVGRTLSFEQASTIQRAGQVIRQADPGRAIGGDVWDGLLQYSRSLNVVAVHRWPLTTSLSLPRYREWMEMRRRLMNPGTFNWTWIQTHMPDWNTQLLYGQTGATAFKEPVGPQPEQIRLLTYNAIASGTKGIAFWSDRFLADSHFGRDRLLECANLNQEIEMLEPVLAGLDDQPQWVTTSNVDVKAAVLRSNKGILVLPMHQGPWSQVVPGQGAVSKLTITVPQVPGSMQAWEVLPGEVRGLKTERVVGGTQVTLPEFGLTSAIVFTSDINLVVRFQEAARSKRQQAAQWTYDMAAYTLDKVLKIEEELERGGHTLPHGAKLTAEARERLASAKEKWDAKLYSDAYRESQRALRPARIIMKQQWDQAVKKLDTPVASPYALSFYTLPKHWELMDQINTSAGGASVLPGGDFEDLPAVPADAWKIEEPTLDEVEMLAIRVTEIQGPVEVKDGGVPSAIEKPKQGKQCALLQIRPKNRQLAPVALERTLLALTSPSVKQPAGTLVRISAWIRIPEPITASVDGALFYDSAGGEPLAIRLTDPTRWTKVSLYRRVPESGQISVTLALTGMGSVYFDDVRIQPMVAGQIEQPEPEAPPAEAKENAATVSRKR